MTTLSLLDQPADDQSAGSELLPAPAGWPAPPDPAVYHELPGEIVNTIAPHTEADPVAILTQLLGQLRRRRRPRRLLPGRSDPASRQRVHVPGGRQQLARGRDRPGITSAG